LSMPVKLNLNNGANTIEFGANQNSKLPFHFGRSSITERVPWM
jgi:hypothetical protein